MSSPQRYLTRMVLFVIAVLLVAGALFQGISGAFMANPALNGVILAVMVVGILLAFRSVVLLRPEIAWVDGFQRGARDQASPHLLGPIAAMLGDQRMHAGKFNISATALRSVLDGLASRLAEGREIMRYLIGLLIFLGLLGTFWGLLQTIGAVRDVIGELSIETGDLSVVFADLQQGLEAPLSGMGTAFSSSLFGLAGSLVLGFLELQVNQAQNRFYNDLEDWLSAVTRLTEGGEEGAGAGGASPAYLKALVAQSADSAGGLIQSVREFEGDRKRMTEAMVRIGTNLAALDDHMRAQLDVMRKLAESHVDLKPAIQRLSEMAASGRLDPDPAIAQHVRAIEAQLGQLAPQLEAARDRTSDEIRAEIKTLTRMIQEISEQET